MDGRPTGSVRISFGYMSTSEDAKTFVRFIQKCFVDLRSSVTGHNGVNGERREEGFDVLLDGGCSNSHEEVAGEIEREVMVTQDMVSGLGSSESLNPECVSQAGCTSSLEGTPHQLAVGDVMYTKVTGTKQWENRNRGCDSTCVLNLDLSVVLIIMIIKLYMHT